MNENELYCRTHFDYDLDAGDGSGPVCIHVQAIPISDGTDTAYVPTEPFLLVRATKQEAVLDAHAIVRRRQRELGFRDPLYTERRKIMQ